MYLKREEGIFDGVFIGITGNQKLSIIGEDERQISYTSNDVVQIVQAEAASPFIIPIGSPSDAENYISKVDGLILTGGQDVTPQLYGENNQQILFDCCYNRDLFEISLIKGAYQQNKPILAICRGMQILNVSFGGTLHQEINQQTNKICHRQKFDLSKASHEIIIDQKSTLFQVLNQTSNLQVNSYHHQSIKQMAPIFSASAWTSDGSVEAFEAKSSQKNITAVQWHPEFMLQTEPLMNNIFREFIGSVKK